MTKNDVEEPNNWNYKPSDLITRRPMGVRIRHVWKNSKTDAVIVHYALYSNGVHISEYVELFKQPEDYHWIMNKLRNLLGSDIEEYKEVIASKGANITSRNDEMEAYHYAIKYMSENKLGMRDTYY